MVLGKTLSGAQGAVRNLAAIIANINVIITAFVHQTYDIG